MILKILLSVFPFTFAAILAVWAILLLAWAIRSWDRPSAGPNDASDVPMTVFGSVLVATAACLFGAAGLALFQ